jgi:hypothetical protein
MTRKNFASILACGALAASLLAAPQRASAGTITTTIPGSGFVTTPGTLGTFSFAIPTGETATSATVKLNNIEIGASAVFYLDGVSLGSAGASIGTTLTFNLSDLSVLDDGTAALSWRVGSDGIGCVCVVLNGGETLTITTAGTPVPEPMTLSLVGMSLLGLGVVRHRRSTDPLRI